MAESSAFKAPNCQTPGCLSPVFVDGNGVPSKYCKRTHKQQVSLSFSVQKVTNPRVGGENAAVSLAVLLQGTVYSSCVSLVTTGRCVRHRSSSRYLEITILSRAVCGSVRSLTMETDQRTVSTQFQQSWRHGTICPEVRAVYKIVSTTASLRRYEQYLYV
jgi:hypothetical protein